MRTALLGNIAERIDYGLTASARVNTGPKFLRITDLQGGTVQWEDVPGCNVDGDVERYELAAGDIVFARTGATTGKSYLIRECPEGAVFASYLIRVRASPEVHPPYLAMFFASPAYWAYIRARSNGSAQPGVNASKLRELPVPLPPFPEQRRIAAILDEADALRRKRREAAALLEELQRSAFLKMFGDPVTNPRGWPTASLGELLEDVQTGWSPRCEARSAEDHEWGVLKLGAVSTGRFVAENKALPAGAAPRSTLEVKAGDVLFSRKNTSELVAAVVYVNEVRPRVMLPDLLFRLMPDVRRIAPRYLAACLMHPGKRAQVQALAAGSSGSMPGVSKTKLRTIEVPVPSSVQQRRFSAWCERFETVRADEEGAIASADDLFHVLLQRAFTGDL